MFLTSIVPAIELIGKILNMIFFSSFISIIKVIKEMVRWLCEAVKDCCMLTM